MGGTEEEEGSLLPNKGLEEVDFSQSSPASSYTLAPKLG